MVFPLACATFWTSCISLFDIFLAFASKTDFPELRTNIGLPGVFFDSVCMLFLDHGSQKKWNHNFVFYFRVCLYEGESAEILVLLFGVFARYSQCMTFSISCILKYFYRSSFETSVFGNVFLDESCGLFVSFLLCVNYHVLFTKSRWRYFWTLRFPEIKPFLESQVALNFWFNYNF